MGEASSVSRLDPSALMQLATAYWGSQVLLTANRVGLFAALGAETLEAGAIAAAIGTAERPMRLLLQACAGLGLVDKTEVGFRNSALSDQFLVPGKPTFLGDALRYSDDLYETWGKLETSLREDRPALNTELYLGRDPAQTRHFVYGMHNRALAIGQALASVIDLTGRKRLLDVGGGPGTYSTLLAQRNPDLFCTVLDLPDVVAVADEIIGSMGVADRVRTRAADYNTAPFPGGNDVVLISGVLHRETPEVCGDLIRRANAALESGGLLIVSDVLTDETGVAPPFATLFGLNMMLTAPHGGVHRDVDVAAWMESAQFADVGTIRFPPPMPHRAVVGIRRP